MRSSRLLIIGAVLAGFGWALAGGCSASGANSPPNNVGGTFDPGDAQSDSTVLMPDASGTNGGSGNSLNVLCGTGSCVPDQDLACQGYQPPPASGAGGAPNAAGQANGGTGEPGAGGDANGGEPSSGAGGAGGQGGASEGGAASGESGSGGAAAGETGQGGAGAEPPPLSYGCQVTGNVGSLARACVAAGLGTVNDPCFSAADCLPALACVTEAGIDAGRCLPYCCEGDGSCKSGTYCAERPLRRVPASSAEPAPRVPVCVPADDCSLVEPFPCPDDMECRCKGDTACMVVRDDHTTTCLTPGSGTQGQACPCAWNHVCSSTTQTCIKLCRIDSKTNECGAQKCQASAELPQDFGVCVGPL